MAFAANWAEHSGIGDDGREGHCMWANDGKLYVFGGDTESAQQTNELFVYDVAAAQWSRPRTSGPAPSPRTGACACVVGIGAGAKAVVFGGADAESERIWQNDVHVLDLATLTWSAPPVAAGQPPSIRDKCACCALGDARNLFCVYGGFGPAAAAAEEEEEEAAEDEEDDDDAAAATEGPRMSFKWFGDVHVLDVETMTWRECASGDTAAPTARCATALCAAGPDAFSAVLFGGRASTGERVNDTWSLRVDASAHTATWHRMQHAGAAPDARSFHTLVAATPQRLVLFGGLSNLCSHFSTVHVLNIGGEGEWRSVPPSLSISPRGFHGAAVANGRMYVYGGGSSFDPSINASTQLHNDLHSLDLAPLL